MTDLLIKSHPSKAQFDAVKTDLRSVYASQYFLIDGFLVSACTQQSDMKVVIVVYVNGWIRGEWLWSGKQSELAHQKWCVTRSYFSTAGAFVAHIKKHNQDIRILEYADYKFRLDQRVAIEKEGESHDS